MLAEKDATLYEMSLLFQPFLHLSNENFLASSKQCYYLLFSIRDDAVFCDVLGLCSSLSFFDPTFCSTSFLFVHVLLFFISFFLDSRCKLGFLADPVNHNQSVSAALLLALLRADELRTNRSPFL